MSPPGDPESKPPRRKRGRLPSVDDTIDEFPGSPTPPVEHLISKVAAVEEVVADHAATLAERYEMPSTEAWARLERRMDATDQRVKVCETEREQRSKWTKLIRAGLGLLGAGTTSALAWAVIKIGDAGEERAEARQRAEQLRDVIESVRALQVQQAVDHAILEDLRTRRTGP